MGQQEKGKTKQRRNVGRKSETWLYLDFLKSILLCSTVKERHCIQQMEYILLNNHRAYSLCVHLGD